VAEIPYLFRNRKNGESKLTGRSIGEFLSLVLRLWPTSRDAPVIQPQGRGLSDADPPQS